MLTPRPRSTPVLLAFVAAIALAGAPAFAQAPAKRPAAAPQKAPAKRAPVAPSKPVARKPAPPKPVVPQKPTREWTYEACKNLSDGDFDALIRPDKAACDALYEEEGKK